MEIKVDDLPQFGFNKAEHEGHFLTEQQKP
jgi:hypothetical protein